MGFLARKEADSGVGILQIISLSSFLVGEGLGRRSEGGMDRGDIRRSSCIKFDSGGRESNNCGGLIGWGVWAVGCAALVTCVDDY